MNCFNGADFLEQALESVKNQSYENWEIIFVDNCSTDLSSSIAKRFQGNLKYFKTKSNIPLGEARNIGLDEADGDYVAVLDVDDLWDSNFLSDSLHKFREDNYALTYAGIKEIDHDGNILRTRVPIHKSGDIFGDQLKYFEINMQTPMISNLFLKKNNIKFNNLMHVSEDFNFFIRIASLGKIGVINKVLASYRVHSSSLTNKNIKYWALDHLATLDQLKDGNQNLVYKYSNEFNYAYARAYYYQARYHFHESNFDDFRISINKVRTTNYIYFCLWLVSWFKPLWKIVHYDPFKRGLSSIMGILLTKK